MKKCKIGFIIALSEFVLIIILCTFFCSYYNTMYRRTLIMEEESKDGTYQIALYEVGETYPLGSTTVEVIVSKKNKEAENSWKGATCFSINVYGTDFRIEWIDEGVILHENQTEASNISHRIYWEDVFKE